MTILNQTVTEAVSPWHPDKIADRVADFLAQWWRDDVRSAIEVTVKDNTFFVAGESNLQIDGEAVHEAVQKAYGERLEDYYPDPSDIRPIIRVGEQSGDIDQIVGIEGAGDNGVMFGWFSPTKSLLHAKLHELLREVTSIEGVYGDAKAIYSAITNTIIVNAHTDLSEKEILDQLTSSSWEHSHARINPKGPFTIGGPWADAGTTGRKLMSDTYGTGIPHGGGAFHGKDLSKVDRSGAYLAHWLATNIGQRYNVEVLVQLSYVIGDPLPFFVLHTDADWIDDAALARRVMEANQKTLRRGVWSRVVSQALSGDDVPDIAGTHFTPDAPWSRQTIGGKTASVAFQL